MSLLEKLEGGQAERHEDVLRQQLDLTHHNTGELSDTHDTKCYISSDKIQQKSGSFFLSCRAALSKHVLWPPQSAMPAPTTTQHFHGHSRRRRVHFLEHNSIEFPLRTCIGEINITGGRRRGGRWLKRWLKKQSQTPDRIWTSFNSSKNAPCPAPSTTTTTTLTNASTNTGTATKLSVRTRKTAGNLARRGGDNSHLVGKMATAATARRSPQKTS